MIDILHSRRNFNIRCELWCYLKEIGNTLEYKESPKGVFYAKKEGSQFNSKNQLGNVFQFDQNVLTISTVDKIDAKANDIVKMRGEKWIVVNVQEKERIEESMFSSHPDKITYLSIRKE